MPKNRPQFITDLDERSLLLFKSLVEHFIQDGYPVGSRTLSRDTGLALSPATIRNVMADLEDMGLLRSPHTSAGRVPTARGLRLFVDSLLSIEQLEERQVRHLAQEMAAEADMQHLITRTSSLLSDITNLAAVVMLPRRQISSLEHIEFVSLSDNRILVILVLSNKEIQNRIIHTAKTYTQSQLQRSANYLNSTLRGKDLDTIRAEVLMELRKLQEDVNELMQAAIEMAQQAFVSPTAADDVVISGQTNLMGVAELSDLDKLKRLFESFNQKRDILHLLENSINAKGIQIFIGEESGYEVLDNCSIVTSPYQSEGRILGVLGVIGPTRMDYERVIPVVDMTAKILSSALNSTD
ncbi:MAG: heat-inducible transcriptional repressor HrcA [Gammaproteobacteria bacterium]|nr:heat-inducible transcriptional repressor HrcA [Gammaproteobacteria bacterium]MCY4210632.1 heat-inducible transcriptional repressor HrcA [Gammaproteobacteria bacterium]